MLQSVSLRLNSPLGQLTAHRARQIGSIESSAIAAAGMATSVECTQRDEAHKVTTRRAESRLSNWSIVTGAFLMTAAVAVAADVPGAPSRLGLKKGDRIILIGNTLAERMQYYGHFETLLHSRFPEHELVVHNLGWSADELTLRPRQASFDDHGHTLKDEKPDVLVAAFGFNESFAGPA